MLRENPWFVWMFRLVTVIAFGALWLGVSNARRIDSLNTDEDTLSLQNARRIDDLYVGEDTVRFGVIANQEAIINDETPVLDAAGR